MGKFLLSVSHSRCFSKDFIFNMQCWVWLGIIFVASVLYFLIWLLELNFIIECLEIPNDTSAILQRIMKEWHWHQSHVAISEPLGYSCHWETAKYFVERGTCMHRFKWGTVFYNNMRALGVFCLYGY